MNRIVDIIKKYWLYILIPFIVLIWWIFRGGVFKPLKEKGGDLNQEQADFIANELWLAMEGMGTDEAKILGTISALNEANFIKVYNAFGVKGYFGWGASYQIGQEMNLMEWLYQELDEIQFNIIKMRYKNIFV